MKRPKPKIFRLSIILLHLHPGCLRLSVLYPLVASADVNDYKGHTNLIQYLSPQKSRQITLNNTHFHN